MNSETLPLAQYPEYPAKMGQLMHLLWLTGAFTVIILLRGGDGALTEPSSFFVEGAPHQSYHASPGGGGGRQQRHGGGLPSRPTSRFNGFSPANRGDDSDSESSSSYFERNGLIPPPIISGRRAQTVKPAAEASNNETETLSLLEDVIEDARLGEDANARLRYDLLRGHDVNFDKYYYDKFSYPWEYVWHNQSVGSRTGVPIETNINFHSVSSVDVVNSVMDLVVWFRMVWVDPRLTWDPAEYGGLNKTWFWLGGSETSEIWTPDIELWNLEEGLSDSLEDTFARVHNDGTVWWSRPGHLRPSCSFTGLTPFPFDTLACTMEFGSWAYSGKFLRMKLYNDVGYTEGRSITAGGTYSEHSFAEEDPIICEEYVYPSSDYGTNAEEDWPGKILYMSSSPSLFFVSIIDCRCFNSNTK